jgi:hypothetical protein
VSDAARGCASDLWHQRERIVAWLEAVARSADVRQAGGKPAAADVALLVVCPICQAEYWGDCPHTSHGIRAALAAEVVTFEIEEVQP